MRLDLRRESDVPIYRQIVGQIRDLIRVGTLYPGYRLPPVRQMAADYGLTRLTVHSAYSELQALGWLESHVGRGTFVASALPEVQRPERPVHPAAPWASQGVLAEMLRAGDALSFAQAFPAPETYPLRELGRAIQTEVKDPGAMSYGPIQGEEELRRCIATFLLERGLSASPEHMLITAGAQQGIDLVLRAVTDPGDVVLVEEPTYPGVLELAAQRRQQVVGVPADAGGVRLDALESACLAHRPRLLYLIPTFGNPRGLSLASERRAAILELAERYNLLVLEDDAYGLLGLDGPGAPPLRSDDRSDRVLYLLSFSKILAPGLRLGMLLAPVSLLPSLAAAKHGSDLVCSTLLQRALAHYLRQGRLESHLQQTRSLYRERRDAMLCALERYMPACEWTMPEGGLSLWVTLPEGVPEREVVAAAVKQGVGIAPGRFFFPAPQDRGHMRLSFGMHPVCQIEEGMQILGSVLDRHLEGSRLLSLSSRPLV